MRRARHGNPPPPPHAQRDRTRLSQAQGGATRQARAAGIHGAPAFKVDARKGGRGALTFIISSSSKRPTETPSGGSLLKAARGNASEVRAAEGAGSEIGSPHDLFPREAKMETPGHRCDPTLAAAGSTHRAVAA